MAFFPTLVFLLLFIPVVAIACVAVAEARREPGRDRPAVFDGAGGSYGVGGCDSGGGGGDGGGA